MSATPRLAVTRLGVDRPKKPSVGDVLEVERGEVAVTWVGRYGHKIAYTDAIGREWRDERAKDDAWTRIARVG